MKSITLVPALLALATAAHAAAPASTPERARQAQCVVRANPQGAVALLTTIPTSVDDRNAGEMLIRRAHACAREQLRDSRDVSVPVETRGLLAEQLIAGEALPPKLPGEGTRRFGVLDPSQIAETGANRATLVFYDTASCVIDQNWPGARALLASAPGSGEERSALAALEPSFGGCLNGVRSMAVPALFARAAIAEEVWHRLHDQQIAAR